MKIWVPLVGVREDLRLNRKWWHDLTIVGAVLSSILVFLIGMDTVTGTPITTTQQNSVSLSLLGFSKGRPGLTTLGQLEEFSAVGVKTADGGLEPLQLLDPPEGIRCENPARFKATESVLHPDPKATDRVRYQAIPDSAAQPPSELRHCVATAGYASWAADQIVTYRLSAEIVRRQVGRGAAIGAVLILPWLVIYWNIYYRGIIPFYAKRRKRRLRSRHATHFPL